MKKLKILFIFVCALQLFYLFNNRSNFKIEILKDPFSKNSGIVYALTPAVIESKNIITKYNLPDFNLSNDLKKIDIYFWQRSVEFNYPIRLKKDSKFIFYKISENIFDSCELVEEGAFIKLARCLYE